LKTEKSTVARSIRAVSLAIFLVTAVTLAAIAWSAYQDYGSLTSVSKDGTSTASSKTVMTGNTARFFLNVSVSNKGLLPFRAELSCPYYQLHVTCTPTSVNLSPGKSGTLHFVIAVDNYTELLSGNGGLHMNGTISFALVPFASLSVNVDLGSLVKG
jgi:hypothetical protein